MENQMTSSDNLKENKIISYLKLMRVHHYLKNGLIFLPLVFGGLLLDIKKLGIVMVGAIAFSMVASIVYVINDIKDVENDRKHSVKCKRPIASGKVTVKEAKSLAIVIGAIAVGLNAIIAGNNIISWVLLIGYLILNILYSNGLKNKPIIDVVILVSGFLIRVLYGAVIVNVEMSNWLYLTVMAMSFYLALGKRRNEIVKQGLETRGVLKFYNHNFLDKNMYMCLTITIVFYSLWCVDPITVARYAGKSIIWTVPVVMIICMKYSLNIEGDSLGDPIDVILSDKVLMALGSIYACMMLVIIYC